MPFIHLPLLALPFCPLFHTHMVRLQIPISIAICYGLNAVNRAHFCNRPRLSCLLHSSLAA